MISARTLSKALPLNFLLLFNTANLVNCLSFPLTSETVGVRTSWRRKTILSASVRQENEGKRNTTTIPSSAVSMFEGAVQSITGDTNYQFGDMTKSAVAGMTGKDPAEEYQFGDITKNTVSQLGKALTGKEEYQIGDFTKTKLLELDQAMGDWRNDTFQGFPSVLWKQLASGLDAKQSQALIVTLLQTAAVALLTWGLMSNICTGITATVAWTSSSLSYSSTAGTVAPLLPFLSLNSEVWRTALSRYTTLRILLDPFFLVFQGAGTLFYFMKYHNFVAKVNQEWISARQRERYPILHRFAALAIAFFVNNVVISFGATICGLLAGSGFVRVVCRLIGPALG